MLTITRTRTHTFIEFANPFLVCEGCGQPVTRMHRHERCGCNDPEVDRNPCCGSYGERSTCPSWGPVDGCTCVASLGYIPHGPAGTSAVKK